jgi:squalene-hopene/tetraprenyl-beta-curcumene cyclase
MTAVEAPRDASVRSALDRAASHLISLQHPDGFWKGELETNVTIDAEDLFLRHYLGLLDAHQVEATARWIRSKQRADGSWATFYGGPADVSTSAEAYLALRLAGDDPEAEHMRRASSFVREAGGLEATRVFTRMWLSLLGLWSWHAVPVLPPEQMLLPARAPLSIYSFGCWARQTIVALQIATALRPAKPAPFAVDELRSGREPDRGDLDLWGRAFTLVDRALHVYGRHPVGPLRRRALRAAERWLVARQEADGSWGGIQPPWVWSIVALHALGYPLDHPVLAKALAGLDVFTIEDEHGRRIEACQSPVWDTALATIGLLDAGVAAEHDAVVRAADWLVGREVRVRGDWSVRRPALEPGGFPFEFANDGYPDIDDTAEIVIALRRSNVGGPVLRRSVSWMLGMQSSNGGWAAFDADNMSGLPARLPFCDFGEVTDPPSADVTAHVVEALALEGLAQSPEVQRGVAYLLREQEADGSWFGRWGANHLYGTGAAVPALVACGLGEHESVGRAVAWLRSVQNADGGFGEDLRSYRDPVWRGRGASTASQTAWALLALHAAGERGPVVDNAVQFLVDTQLADGSWDEPWFTGTGFPGDFYLNYHLYRQVFPVSALGRVLEARGTSD